MSLVETDWLEMNLNKVKIIDCSWHMPQTKRSADPDTAGAGAVPSGAAGAASVATVVCDSVAHVAAAVIPAD